MRLLTTCGKPTLKSFHDDSTRPRFAILSHTWFEDNQEVGYADIVSEKIETSTHGWRKIFQARERARLQGFRYIWIDTCCIDKSSSAELSEAINSMFNWYRDAAFCMVYLVDLEASSVTSTGNIDQLSRCRWFTRGWTLQEMLAPMPDNVLFFNRDWENVGRLSELASNISSITGVHTELLQNSKTRELALTAYSVAQKMSWAASRTTSRIEDRAYCLLGLFNITLPIIYGEGAKSFFRLQEQILRVYPDDQTILLWEREGGDKERIMLQWKAEKSEHTSLLAPSPANFASCRNLIAVSSFPGTCEVGQQLEVISNGIRLWAPVVEAPENFCAELERPCIAFLRCQSLSDDVLVPNALELLPVSGTQHLVAKRAHRVDAYIVAKYAFRSKPVSIYFSAARSLLASGRLSLKSHESTTLEIEKLLVRWVGKTGMTIRDARSYEAWDHHSQSFTMKLAHHMQTFTGRFVAGRSLLLNRPVWVYFAIRLRTKPTQSLQTALRIVHGSGHMDEPPAMNILSGPWRDTLIERSPRPSQNIGDRIGDLTFASTTARQTVDKILHARIVPAMISNKKHLVIELSVVSSVTKLVFLAVARQLRQFPGLLLDAAAFMRSTTPDQILENADDADKILMRNSQYADMSELSLAYAVGWYYKHDANPLLWSSLRDRRLGRLAKETWLGYTLKHHTDPRVWSWSYYTTWQYTELLDRLWYAASTPFLLEWILLAGIISGRFGLFYVTIQLCMLAWV